MACPVMTAAMPTTLMLRLLGLWTLLGLAASIWAGLQAAWLVSAGLLAGVALVDALSLPGRRVFPRSAACQAASPWARRAR